MGRGQGEMKGNPMRRIGKNGGGADPSGGLWYSFYNQKDVSKEGES